MMIEPQNINFDIK